MNVHAREFAGRPQRPVPSARSAFIRAKRLSLQYGTRLRKIARHIGDLASAFDVTTPEGAARLEASLRRYADTITPWAEATADKFVAEVAQADKTSWRKLSAEIGRTLQREIETAPTGVAMRALQAEQVGLIKSLPLEAAQRVQKIAAEGLSQGKRASEIAAEIAETGEVTKSRATLIARTETGRAAAALTQARAEHVGSVGYIWRTARDGDVRKSHKAMEGRFVAWSDPPTLDGLTGHAGALPNCRCYLEVVIPD